MIRDRVISLWQRPSRTTKEEVARGVVCCPVCHENTRVFLFRATTKRRESSPDLIGYEYTVPGVVGGLVGTRGLVGEKSREAQSRKVAPLAANLPTHNAIKAPSQSTTGNAVEPHRPEPSRPSEAIPAQKIEHRLIGYPPSSRPQLARARRIARFAVLEVCLPLATLTLGTGPFGPSPVRAESGRPDGVHMTVGEGAR